MLVLKKNKGRVVVNCLGIVLTPKSTQKQIEAAIKRKPFLLKFFDNVKTKTNERKEKATGK